MSLAAAAAAIVWCGLVPVFCDVEPEGWHLSPAELEGALASRGNRVAAILAGATFGTPPALEQSQGWARLAERAGVPLIVDSAAAFGVPGVEVADAEVFSLHATKPLPVGEGGLIAVRELATERRLRVLINHGLDERRVAVMVGLNGKLDEWHAAAALAGMDRLAAVIAARQAHAASLRASLDGLGIVFQRGAAASATQFVPALMPSPLARGEALVEATQAGVELRSYFSPPLHLMPAFDACPRHGQLTVTEDIAGRMLSLPMANDLLPEEIERIAACVGSRLG
jgi:dTDP-4-amino-4,6-dideoxygalactose transaminase